MHWDAAQEGGSEQNGVFVFSYKAWARARKTAGFLLEGIFPRVSFLAYTIPQNRWKGKLQNYYKF
ncbi:hypothetical protein [Acutalibacter sp.]|uniref:hypothetical protein n=1 Tax=Acutalibacter sp. TaxID=1918636 RepID=UPI0034DFA193